MNKKSHHPEDDGFFLPWAVKRPIITTFTAIGIDTSNHIDEPFCLTFMDGPIKLTYLVL